MHTSITVNIYIYIYIYTYTYISLSLYIYIYIFIILYHFLGIPQVQGVQGVPEAHHGVDRSLRARHRHRAREHRHQLRHAGRQRLVPPPKICTWLSLLRRRLRILSIAKDKHK